MVFIRFDNRILVDQHFIKWLAERSDKAEIVRKLMYIKRYSREQTKLHNVISYDDATQCVRDGIIQAGTLGGAFKAIGLPFNIRDIDDYFLKTIKFAIYLSGEQPYKCYILTSPDHEEDYEKNTHYCSVKTVVVKSNDHALDLINRYYKEYDEAKKFGN